MTSKMKENDDRGTVADLHLHTTTSDGTDTVEERTQQAKEMGLEAIAITDHDSVPDELSKPVRFEGDLEVITGAELKAEIEGVKIEILGYYVDPTNTKLQRNTEELRSYRKKRNTEMTERFVDKTGIEVTYEGLRKKADGQVGRPDFARLLVSEGEVETVAEAFDKYLGEDGDIYIPMEKKEYTEIIDVIHQAGGVASLAHPGRIDSREVDRYVAEMTEYGLDGIEVWYTYGDGEETTSGVGIEKASKLAEEHGLLRTGGSDCHGSESEKFYIGDAGVPGEELSRLKNLIDNLPN